MKKFILFLMASLPVILMAQSSVFQDGDGESGYKTQSGNIMLNASEAAVKLNYARMRSLGTWTPYWGFNLELKGNDGAAPIISEGKFDPKGTLGFFYTWYANTAKQVVIKGTSEPMSNFKQAYFSVAPQITWAKISLLDTSDFFVAPTYNSATGFKVELSYSRFGFIGDIASDKNSSTVFGISASAGMTDNSKELGLLKFDQLATSYKPGDSTTTLVSKKEIQGHNKDAFKKSIAYGTINADWGIYPRIFKRRIVTAMHWRTKFTEDKSSTNFGFGFYLAKKGAPEDIIGGINFMVVDVFDQLGNKNLVSKTSVNLVVGITPF